MSAQKGNPKQQAAANRLVEAIKEFNLAVVEQVEASRPGDRVSHQDIIQMYHIFNQSVIILLKEWADMWNSMMGHTAVVVASDRIAFKDTTSI